MVSTTTRQRNIKKKIKKIKKKKRIKKKKENEMNDGYCVSRGEAGRGDDAEAQEDGEVAAQNVGEPHPRCHHGT